MGRSLEDYELLNTRSQLVRAGERAFAFHHEAIPLEECQRVVADSYELLAQTARVKHHLVPLAELWTLDRLRRMGMLDRRLTHSVPEVLFVDRTDAGAAAMAAALLASYARGRVNVSSAGETPADIVNPVVVRILQEDGIDMSGAFAKPLTDDAIQAADVIVTLGDAQPLANTDNERHKQLAHWPVVDLVGGSDTTVRVAREELDWRVLRLLSDLLTPTSTR